MKLIPYLHFQGSCEEALNTYKAIFNGSIENINRYDNPAMNAPEDYKNKILHATFQFGENSLMASDTFPGYQLEAGHNIALSLDLKTEEETRNIFNQLAEGGKVTMPLEKQFWGAWFGQVSDRFGIDWMVNCEIR